MPARWLLVLAYALLATGWLFANPPGSAPDEPAHYVRALGVGRGELMGRPASYTGPQPYSTPQASLTARQLRWLNLTTRAIDVPAGLTPDSFACNAFQPELSARCLDEHTPAPAQTVEGEYPPYPYLLPGLLMRTAHDPGSALLVARGATALVGLLLLTLAIGLLWERQQTAVAVLGLVIAVTPMVLFLLPQLSASGPEVAAGICLLAGVLRLARASRHPAGVWLAVGLSAIVLAVSRSLGPLWLLLDAALLMAMLGFRGTGRLLVAGGRPAKLALVCVAVGLALNVGWVATAQTHTPEASDSATRQVLLSVMDLQWMAGEAIGVFGWLDTPMPPPAHAVWLSLVVALAVAAFAVGTRRQRNTLLLLIAVVLALTVGIAAVLIRPTGYDVQARHVLPALLAVPLYAGEVLYRQRQRLPRGAWRAGLLPVLTVVTALQVLGWYVNARRAAVGIDGPVWFLGRSEWQPPLGWVPWMGLILGAAALFLKAGLQATTRPRIPATS